MKIGEIYQPITKELGEMEAVLGASLGKSEYQSILEIGDFVMESPGKRIRPALVILSAKASLAGEESGYDVEQLATIAAAVELIHIASLIHDDVIDRANMRHNRASINSMWGDGVSVVFGDYVYSKAFELISKSSNPAIFSCVSRGINMMCEGELVQVCQRGNIGLSRDKYIEMVKKKTASFFATCCHLGTIVSNKNSTIQAALKEYGMNFGIAFQIADDCKDIVCEQKVLGKRPGQDMTVGEVTLPLLNLLDAVAPEEKARLTNMLESGTNRGGLESIREVFLNSDAMCTTKDAVLNYIKCAKDKLSFLEDSDYKISLNYLADFVVQRTF